MSKPYKTTMLHYYDQTYIRISQHCLPYTKKDISKIERVQRQSARFIMADYSHHSSVTNMLANLNLPSLEYRRTTSSIILFYKTDYSQPYQHPIIRFNTHNFKYQRSPSKIPAHLRQNIIIQ